MTEPFQRGESPCLMVISLLALRSALHTRHRPVFAQPPMNDCSAPALPNPTRGHLPEMNCWSVKVLPAFVALPSSAD
ncbi:hypothetical protein G6F66_015716 [Rhizopus arrhizus]|nr:hypothetical protein G6F66_015716 [Rhizopus arrhizus]